MWRFGGYVAEVIQRNNEGFWTKAKNRYTFEFTRDGRITGFGVNPWAWIYKRFEEGDLLAAKYDELMKIAKQFYKASANSDFQVDASILSSADRIVAECRSRLVRMPASFSLPFH